MGEEKQEKRKVKPKFRFKIAAKREEQPAADTGREQPAADTGREQPAADTGREQPAADIPPFTIRQILNLCWGMTLRLSHDANQKSFGEEFKLVGSDYQIFKDYLDSKAAGSSQSPSNEKEGAVKEKQFTEQVMMAMVKTFRNLSLAREAHVSWVDYQAKRYQNERKFLDEISSLTSTEGEGLFAKLVEFFAGGSIGTLAVTDVVQGLLGTGQQNETPETEVQTALNGTMNDLARDLNNDVGTIKNAIANIDSLVENMKRLIGSDEGAEEPDQPATNEAANNATGSTNATAESAQPATNEAANNATGSTNATAESAQAISSAIDSQNEAINNTALDINNTLTNMDKTIQSAAAENTDIPQNIVADLSDARQPLATAMNKFAETTQSAAGVTDIPPEIVKNLTQSLKTLTGSLETLTDTMNNAAAAAGSTMNNATTSGDPTLTAMILIFVAAGFVSLFAATAIVKLWKRYRISRIEGSLKKEAESEWMTKTRQTIVDCLFLLYKDLRLTYKMEHFYPGYHEHGFISTDDPFGTSREDKCARKIIEDEIIQPISIERSAEIPLIQKDEESDS